MGSERGTGGGAERRRERKVVTVLFCDLVGFTQQAESLDPAAGESARSIRSC